MIESIIQFLEGCGVNKAAQQVEFLLRPETLPFALWETLYVTVLGTLLAYVNVLAVKAGNENNDAILALVKALQSERVREYILNTYDGAVVPLF